MLPASPAEEPRDPTGYDVRRPARVSPFRLHIGQMLKLVAICAVGCAWLSLARYAPPKYHANRLMIHVLTLPLVLAVPVLVLVKRGAWKDWLVLLLIFEPFLILTVVMLGATVMFILYDKRMAVPAILLDGPLLFALRPWLIRLVPKRCLSCHWRALVRDKAADEPDPAVPPDSHRCLACGALFRRWHRGPWLPAHSPSSAPDPTARGLIHER